MARETSIILESIPTQPTGGQFNGQPGHLFQMKITKTRASGPLFQKAAADMAREEGFDGWDAEIQKTFTKNMGGWFMYFQGDDGAIPVEFHAKEDDPSSINFKKRIIADIQADFKMKGSRKEADPTSAHRSRYMYAVMITPCIGNKRKTVSQA